MSGDAGGGGGKRRVSFLMPYIDFCFMLIIIFVSMVSIAYFEPMGATELRPKQDQSETTQGQYDTRPAGIESPNAGLGRMSMETKPLVAPGTNVGRTEQMINCPPIPTHTVTVQPIPIPQIQPIAQPQRKPTLTAPVPQKIVAPVAKGIGPGQISKEEYDELKKLFDEQQKQIEELKAQLAQQKTGVSDHLYLDLRNK